MERRRASAASFAVMPEEPRQQSLKQRQRRFPDLKGLCAFVGNRVGSKLEFLKIFGNIHLIQPYQKTPETLLHKVSGVFRGLGGEI